MLYVLFLCCGKEFVDKTLLIYCSDPADFFPNLTGISTAVARVSQRQLKTCGWRWLNVYVIWCALWTKKKGNKQRAILELFQSEKEINTNESD